MVWDSPHKEWWVFFATNDSILISVGLLPIRHLTYHYSTFHNNLPALINWRKGMGAASEGEDLIALFPLHNILFLIWYK